jgi:hypothetical protein
MILGLAAGAGFGQAGNMVPMGAAQNVLWALSSLGLVVSNVLLSTAYHRGKNELVAAGFLLLAIGEMIIWSGGHMGEPGAKASFTAGLLFQVPALFLISVPKVLPIWVRALGILAASCFARQAFDYLMLWSPSTSSVFVIVGYIGLTLAFIGYIIEVARTKPE